MLWLAALNPEVLAVVERSELGQTLGRERMFFNVETAVQKYLAGSRVDTTAEADRGNTGAPQVSRATLDRRADRG
jgi:hypothetical protein